MPFEVSGVWRRLGAFILDALILGGCGILLGLFFSEQFAQMGGHALWIGFIIAGIYFTSLNSRLGNGQTLGKRAFQIQVVDIHGESLNPIISSLRYLILGLPYFLDGAPVRLEALPVIYIYLISLLVFGFSITFLYLLLFNRHTRQSFHDLLLGTYVIKVNRRKVEKLTPPWRIHYLVCACLLLSSLLLPVFTGKLTQHEVFAALDEVRKSVQSHPLVRYAAVSDGVGMSGSVKNGTSKTKYLSAQVFLIENAVEDEAVALETAALILAAHKQAIQRDTIRIVLIYGYDIGIASYWRKRQYAESPQIWLQKQL
jgi:uncharacterized RDD family membrane protein YckC